MTPREVKADAPGRRPVSERRAALIPFSTPNSGVMDGFELQRRASPGSLRRGSKVISAHSDGLVECNLQADGPLIELPSRVGRPIVSVLPGTLAKEVSERLDYTNPRRTRGPFIRTS